VQKGWLDESGGLEFMHSVHSAKLRFGQTLPLTHYFDNASRYNIASSENTLRLPVVIPENMPLMNTSVFSIVGDLYTRRNGSNSQTHVVRDDLEAATGLSLHSLVLQGQSDSSQADISQADLQAIWDVFQGAKNASRYTRLLNMIGTLIKKTNTQSSSYKPLENAYQNLYALKLLSDIPKMVADNMVRIDPGFLSPADLKAEMEKRGWKDKADLVVVGLGPTGLATLYHAARAGKKVVVFEGGYAFQNFSNENQPVHELRTSCDTSSILPTDIVPSEARIRPGHHMPLNRPHHGNPIRKHVIDSIQHEDKRNGWANPLEYSINDDNGFRPALRGEFFKYLDLILDDLKKLPNVIVVENAPVSEVSQKNASKKAAFSVETEQGHQVKAGHVLMTYGLLGTEGEWIRIPKMVEKMIGGQPDQYLKLTQDADLLDSGKLSKLYKNEPQSGTASSSLNSPQPVIAAALLGRPEVWDYLKALPNGARMGVIGSGETAGKSALELLRLNPQLRVDIFLNGPLLPAQVQTPGRFFQTPSILRVLRDSALGFITKNYWQKEFGTPITTPTALQLLREHEAGRIRIFELNQSMEHPQVELETVATKQGVTTRVVCKQPEIMTALQQQNKYYRSKNLPEVPLGDDGLLSILTGGIVLATGYDLKKASEQNGLLKSTIDKGLLQYTEGVKDTKPVLTGTTDRLKGIGGPFTVSASDSTIRGACARAYHTVLNWFGHPHSKSPAPIKQEQVRLTDLKAQAPGPSQLNLAEVVHAGLPDEPPISMLRDLVSRSAIGAHLNAPERVIVERGLMHSHNQTGVLS
jgi:hypothetical protein